MTTDLLLDSGAYSAKTQKKRLDIDDYIDYIKAHQDVFDKYFNLDVIGNGDRSYQNYLYMKSKGLNPIPVWHAETDTKFLELYLENCEYIAIGAISSMSNKRTIQSLDDTWKNHLTYEGEPVCKVHGFGLTSLYIMTRYPWYSVDSTSWVQFGRYGVILIPHTRGTHNWVYNENPHIITVSSKSPRIGDHGKHIDALGAPNARKKFIEYIESRGFTLEEVANNHLARDKINMLYYMSVEQSMPNMKLYLAGNFPVMKDPVKERDFRDTALGVTDEWRRLLSYFYPDDIKTVIEMRREEITDDE